jgi:hypothetical protein
MLSDTQSARTGNGQHMSDTSQGAGWWLASDGKWYPPETWTGPPRAETLTPEADPGPAAGDATAAGPASYPSQPTTPAPGYPPFQPTYQMSPNVAQPRTNGLAVASLVCACAGIVPFFFGITCVLGVIFGFVSRNQIKNSNGAQQGSGLALAGIIVGFSLIGIFIVVVIVIAAVGGIHTCAGTNGFCSNT